MGRKPISQHHRMGAQKSQPKPKGEMNDAKAQQKQLGLIGKKSLPMARMPSFHNFAYARKNHQEGGVNLIPAKAWKKNPLGLRKPSKTGGWFCCGSNASRMAQKIARDQVMQELRKRIASRPGVAGKPEEG